MERWLERRQLRLVDNELSLINICDMIVKIPLQYSLYVTRSLCTWFYSFRRGTRNLRSVPLWLWQEPLLCPEKFIAQKYEVALKVKGQGPLLPKSSHFTATHIHTKLH